MEFWKLILWLSVLIASFWLLPRVSDFYCKQKGYLSYQRSYRMFSLLYFSVFLTIGFIAIAHFLDWKFKHITFGAFPAMTALLSFLSVVGFSDKSITIQKFLKKRIINYDSITSAGFNIRGYSKDRISITLTLNLQDATDITFFQYGNTNFYQTETILLQHKVPVHVKSEVDKNTIEVIEDISDGVRKMLLRYLS